MLRKKRTKIEFYPYCLHFSLTNLRREGNSMIVDVKLALEQIYDDKDIYDTRRYEDQEVVVYFNALYKSECMERKLKNDFKYLFDGSLW